MSIFFWYKNAALIEKQHPMVAGFFRLKDRKVRRPGYAVDSLPVHLWKRGKEITALADHLGEVRQRDGRGLAANPKEKRDRRALARTDPKSPIRHLARPAHRRNPETLQQCQRYLAGDRVSAARPARRPIVADPLQPARSQSLFKAMGKLRQSIQELRLGNRKPRANGSMRCSRFRPTSALATASTSGRTPTAAARFAAVKSATELIKYDAINNRVVYSRQELQRIWSQT